MMTTQIEKKHQSKHKPPKLSSNSEMQGNVNLVTANKGKHFGSNKFKKYFKLSGRVQKNQKQKSYYVCGKIVHFPKQYKFPKTREMDNRAIKKPFFNKLT